MRAGCWGITVLLLAGCATAPAVETPMASTEAAQPGPLSPRLLRRMAVEQYALEQAALRCADQVDRSLCAQDLQASMLQREAAAALDPGILAPGFRVLPAPLRHD